jgi:Holliday junction resolvase RusA-like endonuclease
MEPPSTNKMYVHTYHGPVLSGHTKQFREVALAELSKQEIPKLDRNVQYMLDLTLYMQVLNKTYPAEAKSKFKKKDISNKVKVLEDVVCACLGIDDSQFVEVRARKVEAEEFSILVRLYSCMLASS